MLTNAILHGTGLYVALTCTVAAEYVEVAVINEGTHGAKARSVETEEDAECGRGLLLVEAFASTWGQVALTADEARNPFLRGNLLKVWFRSERG